MVVMPAVKPRRNGLPPHPMRADEYEPSDGENNRLAAFTAQQAVEVVRLVAGHGLDKAEVAALFGVSLSTVDKVLLGRTYMAETLEVRKRFASRKA